MIIVSNIMNLAMQILPPRLRFRLLLLRIDRWGTFEHGYHLLKMLVDHRRCAIDVGANEGYYAGKMARYTARVHCFEPIPWMADDLASKLPGSVVLHRAAVSDRSGTACLRIPYEGDVVLHGTATIEAKNELGGTEHTRKLDCKLVTLDEVIDDPVGFIKIDVEGHELAVLKGAVGLLERCRPIVLIESERRHHPDAPENVFEFFAELGYVGLALINNRLCSLEGFDVLLHQAPDRKGRRYVNNFLFFPPFDTE